MSSEYHFVIECQNKVFSGQALTDIEAKKLLNISKSELKTLSDSANKITRKFQGNTVDVEQLSRINSRSSKIKSRGSYNEFVSTNTRNPIRITNTSSH